MNDNIKFGLISFKVIIQLGVSKKKKKTIFTFAIKETTLGKRNRNVLQHDDIIYVQNTLNESLSKCIQHTSNFGYM